MKRTKYKRQCNERKAKEKKKKKKKCAWKCLSNMKNPMLLLAYAENKLPIIAQNNYLFCPLELLFLYALP